MPKKYIIHRNVYKLNPTIMIIQWTGVAVVAIPFFFHWLIVNRWSRNFGLSRPENIEKVPRLGLILPCWNEELIIAGKLDDIARQEFPREKLKIIIIDSASTDGTLGKIEDWMSKNAAELGDDVSIIVEEERRGKSAALIRVIDEISDEVDIIAMSDIDARLEEGSLIKIVSWFENPEIGAVCGRSVLNTTDGVPMAGQEVAYRGIFDLMRMGESFVDSTPIFEGSLAAFRAEVLEAPYLDEKTVADDSELAVYVRNKGFRSIQDPEIVFFEAPSKNDSFISQKVRRAQGLVQMFWKNRSVWFRPNFGKWGYIMGIQGVMHIFLPWIVLIGLISGSVNFFDLILGFWHFGDSFMGDLTLVFSSIFAFLYLLGLTRFSIGIAKVITTFINYNMIILGSQIQLIRGRTMHKWSQVTSVRESIASIEGKSETANE